MFVGMYGAAPVINKRQIDKRVILYKQTQPNSKMSDKQKRDMIKEEMSNELNSK